MAIYGYARVSTTSQELEIQLARLRDAGCTSVFCEKKSGMSTNLRELKSMLKSLKPGDVVIVPALDRLTRGGCFRTLSVLNEITSRQAKYKSLAEPWIDTTDDLGELLAAIWGFFARQERNRILLRTAAGRERAKACGVKFGRPLKLTSEQQRQAAVRRAAGESQRSIAQAFNVSCSTISRLDSLRRELDEISGRSQ